MDLFESQGIDTSGIPAYSPHAPLAVRMRPVTIEEVVGQQHLLVDGSPLRRLLDTGENGDAGRPSHLSSVLLWGPPGTGKTTLAYLVAHATGRRFEELSAVSSGVSDLRAVIAAAKRRTISTGEETVLFIDEVHRFSKSQQDALLPAVENRWLTLIAATTENPSFSVISPLISRSLLLTLKPLDEQDISSLIERALSDERGFNGRYTLDDDARESLIRIAGADGRKSLTLLEAAAETARHQDAVIITIEHLRLAADQALVRWDKDQHYDVASAFIKSMRGSDVDAAIHYLARMIEAGEDPRFIARRVVIAAAEDVGMAAPEVLQVALAAAQAVALIGMPEARIILAQAVVAVATAPKSNAAYMAIDAALADVRSGKAGPVPMHLRDSHYSGAEKLGHGQGYLYAHDQPHSIAGQQYLPDDLEGTRYYFPTTNGNEAMITKRLQIINDFLKVR